MLPNLCPVSGPDSGVGMSAIGFMLGVGLRAERWGEFILLTQHRPLMTHILVYYQEGPDLLPDMPAPEKIQRKNRAR